MVIGYQTINVETESNCPICWEEMRDKDCVAHAGNGALHPLHRACAINAAARSRLCPCCREVINPESWQKRSIKVLKDAGSAVTARIGHMEIGVVAVNTLFYLNLCGYIIPDDESGCQLTPVKMINMSFMTGLLFFGVARYYL